MSQLDDLPDELLLNVAHLLANDSRPIRFRLHDLCSFTLTSKRHRGIVQEVLHHSITIRAPVVKVDAEGYQTIESLDPPRIALLCRTLLERPDLAVKARILRVYVWDHQTHNLCPANVNDIWGRITQIGSGFRMPTYEKHLDLLDEIDEIREDCPPECACEWQEIFALCKRHLVPAKFPWATPAFLDQWLRRIPPGRDSSETALVGVALSCTRFLQQLDTVPLSDVDKWWVPFEALCPADNTDEVSLRQHCYPWILQVEDLFCGLSLPSNFSLPMVEAFSSLKYIRSTELVPWSIACLPKLETLHLAVDNDVPRWDDPADLRAVSPDLVNRANLTRLIIDVEIAVLLSVHSIKPTLLEATKRYTFFEETFLPQLSALKYLAIRIRTSWELDVYPLAMNGAFSYDNLTRRLSSKTLETLLIDLSDVKFRRIDGYDSRRVVDISHAASLSRLPNLRRIAAPEELYFSVAARFWVCDLPPSLVTIEMIDTSDRLERYARHLIVDQHSLPNLTIMRAWCDHRPGHVLSKTGPDNVRIHLPECEREYRTESQIAHVKREVSSQLSQIGVEIDWRPGRTRGWRKS
jgi:hypothetical protein